MNKEIKNYSSDLSSRMVTFIVLVFFLAAIVGDALAQTEIITLKETKEPNQYTDVDGTYFTGPPVLPKPDPLVEGVPDPTKYRDTGPFHRISSQLGYSFYRGKVYLPCSAGSFNVGETGFVYTGGWGATKDGAAVDAGFQKSTTQDGSLKDNYALFMRLDNPKSYGGTPYPQRFRCNQAVNLAFGPFTANSLQVTATGTILNGEHATVTVTLPINAYSKWPSSGGGNTDGVLIKRMTTIGQPSGWSSNPFDKNFNPHWNSDGSYFGIPSITPAQIVPEIRWSSSELGRVNSSGRVEWTPWSDSQTLREDVWPADNTRIITGGPTNDAVAIFLHP